MIFAAMSSILRNVRSHASKIQTTTKNYKTNKSGKKSELLKIDRNSVIISQSRDIFENLAFEDWVYKNCDFSSNDMFLLLLWYNGPSVVIGRHQNPWIECSVDFCQSNGVSIARRNSGGGTVYHDYGNVNFSFFSAKKHYNRKNNLNLISDSISNQWPVNLSVTKRDDILCNKKYKVSGTAAKLGRTNAYHHCTILVNVDELKLHQALHRELGCIKSKATASTRAEIVNLKTVCSDINVVDVIKVVTDSYKQLYAVKNTLSIYPNEKMCPGMATIQNNLMSWNWCFGHTPRFTMTKFFPICSTFSSWKNRNLPPSIEITITSNKGIFENIILNPQILEKEAIEKLNQSLVNSKFSDKINVSLEKWTEESNNELLCKFIKCCILQMIFDVLR